MSIRSFVKTFVKILSKRPLVMIFIISLITALLFREAVNFQDNMTSDVEAFLPEGDEATDILKEVRLEWTTDIIVIYVETENKYNPNSSKDNMTDKVILEEISKIEGDDFTPGIDWNKVDRGDEDGIIFILSISTIIKELNSSHPRFLNALENQSNLEHSYDDEEAKRLGEYAIPETQERIDEIVNQTDKALRRYVIDTNNDTIWDTGVVLIGIRHDIDQREMVDIVEEAIKDRKEPKTVMTTTGVVVVLQDVTDRVYDDLLKMIPIAFLFVVLITLFFHRSLKVLLIVGIPVIFSLIWTFGIIKAAEIEITPMVVASGPILIGLGIDYGLHVTNRIEEFKLKEDIISSITDALCTTGKAVLLSAITTIIGFTALLISNIIPMRTVGIVLFVGISCMFFLTIILVPCLIIVVGYKKRQIKGWKKVGEIPVKYYLPILIITLMLTIIAIINIGVLNRDIRGDESAPQNIKSLDKIKEYTETFKAGQTGVIIVTADVKDIDVLDAINETEVEINAVENTSALSVVDLFKSIEINFSDISNIISEDIPIPKEFQSILPPQSMTLWEFMHLPWDNEPFGLNLQRRAIEISYETLSEEMRGMFINRNYTKTLIYTEMPYVNIKHTKKIVNEVNEIIDNHQDSIPNGKISHLTGGAPVTIAINDGIHKTQIDTTILSIILVFIVLCLAFRSLRIGIITLIPIIIVVLWQALIMAGGDINVNIFTAMIGTIIIGVGIDFSIHISERIKEEGETLKGIEKATEKTGQTLVEAAGTTVCGVAAGFFVSFQGLLNFFMIVMILVIYSLIAGLFVLPSIYAVLVGLKKKSEE